MSERERIERQNAIDSLRHSIKCWKQRRARYRRELQKSEDKLSRAQAYGYRHKLAEAQAEIPEWIALIKSTSFYIDLWESQLAAKNAEPPQRLTQETTE